MKPRIRLDNITLLLIGMLLLMGSLLAYLVTIDRDINGYNRYDTVLQELLLLDSGFDNFFLHKIEAVNYESINRDRDRFEETISWLIAQPLAREYGAEFPQMVHEIGVDFRKKSEAIEAFKSYNTLALNSIHYIFDLRRTLLSDPNLSQEIQLHLDKILFSLMQMILGIQTSKETLTRELENLKKSPAAEASPNLLHLINHSLSLTEAIRYLNETTRRAGQIPLHSKIDRLKESLHLAYERKIFIEKVIALLFFVLTFILIVILIGISRRARQTHQRLQAFMYAVENSDNTVVMTDPDRTIVYVNEAFEKSTGYSRLEALGQNTRILKSGKQDRRHYDEMNRILNEGKKWQGEFINKRKDGTLYYEKASIVPVFVDGRLTNYLAIKLDITEYILQQQKLKLSAAVFENAQESIFITDRTSRIIAVNQAFTAITGYVEEELEGKTPNILKSGYQDETFYRKMWEKIRDTGRWHGKIYNRIKSGEILPMWLTVSSLYDEKGNLLNYIGMLTDLREIIQNQERAEFLAYHDPLTDLPNRAYFEEHLFHAIELAKRKKNILAILFIDLDRFKVINDTLGHDVGDRLLKVVSERMRTTLRKSDMIARVGGDEFIAVIESIATAEETTYVCEKLLKKIAEPIRIASHTLNVSASIGVSLFPDNGSTITDLIKNADNAMYLAKNMGKNNFQFFMPELSRMMHRRLDIEQGLNKALLQEEFWVTFQPQYRLEDGSLYGAEVLLRWKSPTLGIVPPDEFIPVAEETGRIHEIGMYVFEEACKTLVTLEKMGLFLENISVNVSSKQFMEKGLPEAFSERVAFYGLSPERITIEMTESYIMDTSTYDDTMLHTLKRLGFKISVDDFGTGYSSMSYLKILPIDSIKIDKSFITDIPHDPNDNAIAKAIIVLSNSLGYHVVAEGIEHPEQERFLLEQGCAFGQGYHYSRPIDLERFIAFVRTKSPSSLPLLMPPSPAKSAV
ncbi:EAL domain-containing protein [Hydrogenimonas sp.]